MGLALMARGTRRGYGRPFTDCHQTWLVRGIRGKTGLHLDGTSDRLNLVFGLALFCFVGEFTTVVLWEEKMSTKDMKHEPLDISRRGFLKGVGAGAVATGLLQEVSEGAGVAEAAESKTLGPGAVPIKLNVNGKTRSLSVEPRVTLLDALRNRLDVTGPKKACDRGTCGACTVMLDGKVVYSCNVLAVEAEGKKIVTVEGLGTPEALSDMQEAFVKHDASQCGFCTPGFVVATTAFVRDNPGATLEEVRAGLGGNLCRCGTYAGITAATLEQAQKGGA